MKVTQFDKPILRAIRPTIEAALATLEEQLGVKVTLGTGRYSSTNVTFKFEMAIVGPSGQAENKDEANFKMYAHLYVLDPSDLGRRFVCRGEEFIINGLRPSATKRPIMAKGRGGKQFVFPAALVKARLLGPKASADGIVIPPCPPSAPTTKPASGATKRVWEIADAIYSELGGRMTRANVIQACSATGINSSTAATQFGRWKKARSI